MTTSTQQIYAVLDVKSGLYSSVHLNQSHGVAIRSFSTACEDENTQFYKHPSDYSLYHLGEIDIETGKLSQDTPIQISNASEFVKSDQ